MILRPDFYVQEDSIPWRCAREMGFAARRPLPRPIVAFRRPTAQKGDVRRFHEKTDAAGLPFPLILICGRTMSWRENCARTNGILPVHHRRFPEEVS